MSGLRRGAGTLLRVVAWLWLAGGMALAVYFQWDYVANAYGCSDLRSHSPVMAALLGGGLAVPGLILLSVSGTLLGRPVPLGSVTFGVASALALVIVGGVVAPKGGQPCYVFRTLQFELQSVASAQEAFLADSHRYAATVAELHLEFPPQSQIELVRTSDTSYEAFARLPERSPIREPRWECAVFGGTARPDFPVPDADHGSATCYRASRAR